jgi:hypothetical protein
VGASDILFVSVFFKILVHSLRFPDRIFWPFVAIFDFHYCDALACWTRFFPSDSTAVMFRPPSCLHCNMMSAVIIFVCVFSKLVIAGGGSGLISKRIYRAFRFDWSLRQCLRLCSSKTKGSMSKRNLSLKRRKTNHFWTWVLRHLSINNHLLLQLNEKRSQHFCWSSIVHTAIIPTVMQTLSDFSVAHSNSSQYQAVFQQHRSSNEGLSVSQMTRSLSHSTPNSETIRRNDSSRQLKNWREPETAIFDAMRGLCDSNPGEKKPTRAVRDHENV